MELKKVSRARSLRRAETKSEKLLWALLRSRQLCDLKFRRQHPIGLFIVDFACVRHQLIIEVDGGYHDYVTVADRSRQEFLNKKGWHVIRVTSAQVENEPEGVGVVIASHLGLEYQFSNRYRRGKK